MKCEYYDNNLYELDIRGIVVRFPAVSGPALQPVHSPILKRAGGPFHSSETAVRLYQPHASSSEMLRLV